MSRSKQTGFGQRLREARREMGLSQENLAEAADLSRDAVVRLERGERTARVDTAVALARALGVTPAYLIGDAGVDERLARLGAVLRDADEETFAVVTAVAKELMRLRPKPPHDHVPAEPRAPYPADPRRQHRRR